jgi:hypothetical protein
MQGALSLGALGAGPNRVDVIPGARVRVLRAGLTALVWAVSALPVLLGYQQCAIATLFHVPCPGCGMTRALRLLVEGHAAASLRMHPLALPVLAAGSLLILSTVWTALTIGMPFYIHQSRFGRAGIAFAVVVYALATALWVARWFGHFGGPVSVF